MSNLRLKILNKIYNKFPLRQIYVNGELYLERNYLFGNSRGLKSFPEKSKSILGWLPFTVYIHHFLKPDAEEELHNHPWTRAMSAVLNGGYKEEYMKDGKRVSRYCKSIFPRFFNHDHCHKIATIEDNTWTLFVVGKNMNKSWGFLSGEKIVNWRELESRR